MPLYSLLTSVLFFLLAACTDSHELPHPPPPLPTERIDILALGDSYTKGEGVPGWQNFPNQLTDSLRARGYNVAGVRVIAQTGWRTDQLQGAITQATDLVDSTFSLVTLCIGVNNQYQGRPIDEYKTQFEQLLQTALTRAGGRRERVLVLSIPDWAYTPFGQSRPNPAQISAQIDAFNDTNRTLTLSYGIVYMDVTEISRLGVAQPGLVASDGLHPSAAQYTAWVKKLLPAAESAF